MLKLYSFFKDLFGKYKKFSGKENKLTWPLGFPLVLTFEFYVNLSTRQIYFPMSAVQRSDSKNSLANIKAKIYVERTFYSLTSRNVKNYLT